MVANVQARLKSEFVKHGLMLGEFFPGNPTGGLHSAHFRPLAAPVPLLAIRRMVASDLSFLVADHVPPAQRLYFLGCYRETFKGRLKAVWAERLDAAEKAQRRAAGADA